MCTCFQDVVPVCADIGYYTCIIGVEMCTVCVEQCPCYLCGASCPLSLSLACNPMQGNQPIMDKAGLCNTWCLLMIQFYTFLLLHLFHFGIILHVYLFVVVVLCNKL